MLKKCLFIAALFIFWGSFSSCEDVIEVDVEQKQKKIVVDAFIDTRHQTQTIRLTESIPYFDIPGTEPPLTTANVILVDTTGGGFASPPKFFQHDTMGYYRWTPNPNTGDTLKIGASYALIIIDRGDTIIGQAQVYPTVERIDSLRTIPTKGNGPPFIDTGRYAELFAYDLPGLNNFYWIKTFRNDTLLKNLNKLNIAQDMGNNSNGQDGGLFIYPVRFSELNEFLLPYTNGEKIRVEIHSISQFAFLWFRLVENQRRNGGLFATPPVNIPGVNLFMLNKGSKRGLAGVFNIAAVNSVEITVED